MNAFENWKFPRKNQGEDEKKTTTPAHESGDDDGSGFAKTIPQAEIPGEGEEVRDEVVLDTFPVTETMEIVEAPLSEYSRIIFRTDSNLYTLKRDNDGGFVVHQTKTGTSARIEPELARTLKVKKG